MNIVDLALDKLERVEVSLQEALDAFERSSDPVMKKLWETRASQLRIEQREAKEEVIQTMGIEFVTSGEISEN